MNKLRQVKYLAVFLNNLITIIFISIKIYVWIIIIIIITDSVDSSSSGSSTSICSSNSSSSFLFSRRNFTQVHNMTASKLCDTTTKVK
jgi:hypothetical protein